MQEGVRGLGRQSQSQRYFKKSATACVGAGGGETTHPTAEKVRQICVLVSLASSKYRASNVKGQDLLPHVSSHHPNFLYITSANCSCSNCLIPEQGENQVCVHGTCLEQWTWRVKFHFYMGIYVKRFVFRLADCRWTVCRGPTSGLVLCAGHSPQISGAGVEICRKAPQSNDQQCN